MGTSAKPSKLLADVVKWLVVTFGVDVVVMLKDAIQRQWRRVFAARNILILGPKQAGKSSLVQYLRTGRPYEIIDGEIRPPAPTAMAAIVDSTFGVQKGNWLRLKKDVTGDLDFRDTWAQAIVDIRPHGILYIIDGRRDDDGLRDDVRGIERFVLVHYNEHGVGHLGAIHVLVNFADQWATSPVEARRRLRVVRDEVDEVIGASSSWATLRVGVAETQLAPSKKSWDEADRAIHHFGADLVA